MNRKDITGALDEVSERYARLEPLRPLMQLIPFGVGSAIDSLFGNRAADMQMHRIRTLLDEVTSRLETIEEEKIDPSFLESDDFYYHCREIFTRLLQSRGREKVALFAQLFVKGIAKDRPPSDFISLCADLVSQLELPEMLIIKSLCSLADLQQIQVDHFTLGFHATGRTAGLNSLSDIGPITKGQFQAAVRKLRDVGLVYVTTPDAWRDQAGANGDELHATDLCREFVELVLETHGEASGHGNPIG